MPKRIALLGSAPSSIRFAPFDDQSWFIAGCSPALYPQARRLDAWYELHRMEEPVIGKAELQVPWFSPEYVQWLKQLPIPIYMAEATAAYPASRAYPIREMIAKWGPYIWTSSLAYMFVMALEDPEVEEIGMWGVDMAATEEYKTQRPALQFLVVEAMKRGIKITIPPESDLLQPCPLYGIDESTPMAIKQLARLKELSGRLGVAQQNAVNCQREIDFLRGAIDQVNYTIESWTSTALQDTAIKPTDRPAMMNFRRESAAPPELRSVGD
jgi:hypothetical protein